MKNILIRGPLLSNSGYGNHARQVFAYLKTLKNTKIYAEILNWGDVCWTIDENYENGIIKDILACSNMPKNNNIILDECYQICLPNEWVTINCSFNCGITAGVEADICSKNWLRFVNKMDKVIVPSLFARQTFINTSKINEIEITTKIDVIPEYFYDCFLVDSVGNHSFLDKIKTENNFLILGQLTSTNKDLDRKNIFNLIEDTIEILSEYKSTGIILKTNLSKNSFKDFYKLKNMIKEYNNVLTTLFGEKKPAIYLLHGNLTPLELRHLYSSSKIKAMISGTRGEGFGLPFLEAAACNLNIIAPDYSAYTEFLDGFYKVDYKMIKRSKPYDDIFIENCKWAEYDKNSLKENINKIMCTKRKFLKNNVLEKYNKEEVFKIYKNLLKKV